MAYLEKYKEWLGNPCFDEETRAELYSIKDNSKEIEDRFYRELEFGTGGLRGIIGAGTNRINNYTVRRATQGLANFVLKEKGADKGVVIAYDSRRKSPGFAKEAALCLAANGIKVYLFDALRPTPELSFAVRELGCIAGVVITASHNPAEYNGYKVYWEDGAQITPPKDEQIIAEVNAISSYTTPKTMAETAALTSGKLQMIGASLDDRYFEALKGQVLNADLIKVQGKNLKIVYTPLHGAGNVPVQRILRELGFVNVFVVKEQELPDGNFPTVESPNPENKSAFEMALVLAREVAADVVLATDPDADRLGIYARDLKTGEYKAFTGNMSAMIILAYQLEQRKEKGLLPGNGAIVTTIVSGKMGKEVAGAYDVSVFETLTGFKFIGQKIEQFERDYSHQFLFGYEESYGCLLGTDVRDKDAVVAVMALCEAAAYYQSKGLTLCEQMDILFDQYGYFFENLETVTLKGKEGIEKIDRIMNQIRKEPPKNLADFKVYSFTDYQQDKKYDFLNGKIMAAGLPGSNVLHFTLENDAWCCVRPSGTEPEIKFYIGVKGSDRAKTIQNGELLMAAVKRLVE